MNTLLQVSLVWIGVSVVTSLLLGRFIAVGKGKPFHRNGEELRVPLGARHFEAPAGQSPESRRNVA